jgi:hypothetical protein
MDRGLLGDQRSDRGAELAFQRGQRVRVSRTVSGKIAAHSI